jgi:D-3-phosphoglycerate dehydrogenase / 2-oxoglutarate reductase
VIKVLVAGDHFVRAADVERALRDRLPGRLDVAALTGPWPLVPFGPVDEVDEASGDVEELAAALRGVEVAVTQMAPFPERVLREADALRLIAVARGGPVNVNLAAAADRGIAVVATPGRNAPAAAEMTVALMLAALRQLPALHRSMVAGDWRGDLYAYDACGRELAGATVGLVGYGAIGRRVARVLTAFGARVLVADPYVERGEPGVELVELDQLLARSRVVSLHARLTDETRGLIAARELGLLPEGAVLVNTARGALVDEEALVDALESGRLGAAGLDVYTDEPPADDARIRAAPRVVLAPHLAGATRQTADRAIAMVADEIERYVFGEPLRHLVDVPAHDPRRTQ